ncbi:MAG: response regulator transcription factor [Luteimonas sp.]|nr:response regulator transcription factor [Luteimonas sp.]
MEPQPIALTPALIVEDDPAMQVRMKRLVEALSGAPAHVAGSLESARAHLLDAPVSLALVDVQLPDGNGIDLIGWARSHAPGVQSVIVSSWAGEETILAAVRAGAIGYLLKDRDDEELSASLKSLQRGGAPIDPMIARRILALVPRPAAVPEAQLSGREQEILELVAQGYSNREIAGLLVLSRLTVECHTKNIYRKLEVGSRTQAVFEARAQGLLR